jgi:hypothetical protein
MGDAHVVVHDVPERGGCARGSLGSCLHVEAEEVGPKVQIKECLLILLQGGRAS